MKFRGLHSGDARTFTSWCLWPRRDPVTEFSYWLEKCTVVQGYTYVSKGWWTTKSVTPAKSTTRDYPILWFAVVWFWVAALADELISRHMPPGYIEANPFARDFYGRFLFSHAIAHDGFYFLEYLLMGLVLAKLLRPWNKYLNQLPGAAIFLYLADQHMDGFLGNLWSHFGWYVPHIMSEMQMFQGLFR